MPELRYNLLTGDWVIFSPERARRPTAHARPQPAPPGPSFLASCPFCPGNEKETAEETIRAARDGSWLVRSVANRFPALTSEGHPDHLGTGYTRSMRGVGRHEVIVESPRHDETTALLSPEHVQEILRISRSRMVAFYQDPRVEHVTLFKNHGESAGSSLDHPHSQIVGTPVVPGQVRFRVEHALREYSELGECLLCHCLREELSAGVRVVEETPDFVAFLPYAALSPYHVWIVPKRHRAYFGDIGEPELAALAQILRRLLRRLHRGLGNPPFNYVVRSLSPRESDSRFYHWYLSVIVRLNRVAGFELGTGMFINSSLPEESARFLREVEIGEAEPQR